MHDAAIHLTAALAQLDKYEGAEAMKLVVRGLLAMVLALGAR